MIEAILFALAAAVLALELISLGPAAKRVRVDYETDLTLAEPGEVITLRYTVTNPSPLPKLFLGLSFYFGERAILLGRKKGTRVERKAPPERVRGEG